MTNEKTLFAQRLIAAMQKQGYKPEAAVLERGFNLNYYGNSMTLQGVRKWLIGASIPTTDKIIALAKWLKIPPEELTFGTEVKLKIQEKNQRWQQEIGYGEREVFEAFIALPSPQKKIVREVIVAFAKAYAVTKSKV